MFALISRILNLSGRYKSRIQAAFLCAFVESILSKMPIFMAFIVLAGFADNTLTGKTCLFVGLGLLAVVVVHTVVHYLSDRLQRDRKSTRLNSSHRLESRMPSSA